MVRWLRNNAYARWLLTVLRIWIGWQWVSAAVEKVGSPVWTGAQAGTAISGFLGHAASLSTGAHPTVQAWYADFIRGFALPNAQFFSYLIAYGELLVGIALITGTFTTFAALMGAAMNTAYLLAGTSSTNPNLLIGEVFVLIAGYHAAAYGLDHWIIPWFRKAMHYQVSLPGSGSDVKSS